MIELLFHPYAVYDLAVLILNLAVFGYLLSIRTKSIATKWFMVTVGCVMLFWLWRLLESSTLPDSRPWWSHLRWLGTGVPSWAYLQFAYLFLETPFPREARWAFMISTLLRLITFGALVFVPDRFFFSAYLVSLTLDLVFLLWTTMVFLRKWRWSTTQVKPGWSSHTVRAFRSYALINVLVIVAMFSWLLHYLGVSVDGDGSGFSIMDIQGFLQLGFVFGVTLIYLNFAPEPTSFQVKLVGLSLVGVLALLSVMAMVLPPYQNARFATSSPQQQSLRFSPDTLRQAGYVAKAVTYQYDSVLGEDLHMSDDSAQVRAFGFVFPFYDKNWDRLHISPNGIVTFGEPLYRDGPVVFDVAYFYNEVPKIAPLYFDLDPSTGGGVYFKRAEDRVVVTWHEVPGWNRGTGSQTCQLALYRDGTIDFIYRRIEADFWGMRPGAVPGNWGITPGRTIPSATSLWQDLPYTIAPGKARSEDFQFAFRQRAHGATLPLIWVVLGAAFFVLGVFPFIYRSSLVKPLARVLQGVQRVNAGDLTTAVPVAVRDEIGRLTHHFNQMTQSLRQYNSEMEALVAERTAQLEQSLADLKATQSQLVQQEKMASLGQLTAGIAHEIKNPLNFVNNFSQLSIGLADELADELGASEDKTVAEVQDELKELLADLKFNAKKINEYGRRADGIVRAMMQHASSGQGERVVVEINKLVSEHIDLAYHGKRAQLSDLNVELKRELDEDVGRVEVVPQEIGRVLLNLLGNAFDAAYEHARSVKGHYIPMVTVTTQQGDSQVEIRVQDNGLGIPAEIRKKIFEPFFTTKPAGSGTGLGLSLSYDIVTQGHGGTLTVESEEGHGATFTVTLPVNYSAPASRP